MESLPPPHELQYAAHDGVRMENVPRYAASSAGSDGCPAHCWCGLLPQSTPCGARATKMPLQAFDLTSRNAFVRDQPEPWAFIMQHLWKSPCYVRAGCLK